MLLINRKEPVVISNDIRMLDNELWMIAVDNELWMIVEDELWMIVDD